MFDEKEDLSSSPAPPVGQWNDATERIAIAWNDMAQINHKFCIHARAWYGKCCAACSFPVALGGSLLATLVTVMQQEPPVLPRRGTRVALYALAFLGFFMTLLRVAQSVFRIDDRYSAFETAVKGWERFATRTIFELAKPREMRMAAPAFLAAFGRELEDLLQQTPVVPGFIVRHVVRRYRRTPRERQKFDAMFKPLAYRTLFSTDKLMRTFAGGPPPTTPGRERGTGEEGEGGYVPRRISSAQTPQTPGTTTTDAYSSSSSSAPGGNLSPTLLEEGGALQLTFLSIYGLKEEEAEGEGELDGGDDDEDTKKEKDRSRVPNFFRRSWFW